MPQQPIPLIEQAKRLQSRILYFDDCIKQLIGYEPNGFTFTFSMQSQPVLCFEIDPDDSQFTVSFFVAWKARCVRRLDELAKQLAIDPATLLVDTEL